MDKPEGNEASGKRDPAVLIESMQNEDVPHLYCNGFQMGMGNADCVIALQLNSRTVATLNMSYTVTKTLAQKLDGLVSKLESRSGNTIMTTEDVDRHLKKGKE